MKKLIWPGYFIMAGLAIGQPLRAQVLDGSNIQGIEPIVKKIQNKQDWRQAAEENIDKIRKSNMSVVIVNKAGKPLKNAKVYIKLDKHRFVFGGAINSRKFKQSAPLLKIFFNQIGFTNGLKYKQKDRLTKYVDQVMVWAAANEMPVRGHVLVYPGWKYMHKDALALKDDKAALRAFIDNQIIDYARRWDVVEWDAVNETRDNREMTDVLGKDILLHWFKLGKKHLRNKNARLYLNENRVISASLQHDDYVDQYIQEVAYLVDNDAPIDAIGVQSRFRYSNITHEIMNERLDRLARFGLPITATEFEIGNGRGKNKFRPSEYMKAKLTERVMQTYFAHPAVEGMMAWTFISQSKEKKGLLAPDMTLQLNGKMWLYLTRKYWTTEETLQSDKDGRVTVRGFQGDYIIGVSLDGVQKVFKLTLGKKDRQFRLVY